MKTRPFYRWKSFWLGLFVVAFSGWVWVQSMKFTGQLVISAGPGRNAMGIVLNPGVFRIWVGNDGVTRYRIFGCYLSRAPRGSKWLSGAVGCDEWQPGCMTLSISCCFICGGALLAWMGFLLWHGRRVQQKIKFMG